VAAAAIRQAFLQTDAEAAHQTWRHVADQLRPPWPKFATLMDDSEHGVLAYMTFPSQCRTNLHRRRSTPIQPTFHQWPPDRWPPQTQPRFTPHLRT
jgi:transposase-like protein